MIPTSSCTALALGARESAAADPRGFCPPPTAVKQSPVGPATGPDAQDLTRFARWHGGVPPDARARAGALMTNAAFIGTLLPAPGDGLRPPTYPHDSGSSARWPPVALHVVTPLDTLQLSHIWLQTTSTDNASYPCRSLVSPPARWRHRWTENFAKNVRSPRL